MTDDVNAALDAASNVLRANLTDAEDEGYQAAMDRLVRYGGDLRELLAAAEQRGREDNWGHQMCYVHGSKALAALVAEAEERGADRVRAAEGWLRRRADRYSDGEPF